MFRKSFIPVVMASSTVKKWDKMEGNTVAHRETSAVDPFLIRSIKDHMRSSIPPDTPVCMYVNVYVYVYVYLYVYV